MNRRKWVASGGLVMTALLFSLVLVEGILRVYAAVAETSLSEALRKDPYAVKVEPHGEAGYRPRPGRTIEYYNGAAAHINEQGHRGPTVPVPKPDDVVRVALLGGSTTFGWGVDDHETIAAHMRDILAERYPDRMFEVVNLAFDGYDSYQLLERYRSDGFALEPDVVIANTGVNDVRNAWFTNIRDGDRRTLLYLATLDQMRLERELGRPTLWTRTKHWLVVARLPGWLRGQLRTAAARSVAEQNPDPPFHWEALDYFERNIRRLVDLAEDSGTEAVLLSTPPSSLSTQYEPDAPPPVSYWIGDAATTQMYRDSLSTRLRKIAGDSPSGENQIRFLSHGDLSSDLFLDDAHLSSEGNRRVAEHFVQALEQLISPTEATKR